MQYYHDIDGRETYVGKHSETKPTATNFADGMRYLDIDLGIWYTVSNGAWVVDISSYGSSIIKTNGDFVNLADAYYKDALAISSLEEIQLRRGNSFGIAYKWSNVAIGASINLHIKTGANPIYLVFNVAGVGLTDYSLVADAVISNNGTVLDKFPRNGLYTYTSTTSTWLQATYTGGVSYVPRFLGVGGNVQTRGGGTTNQVAIIVSNTDRILNITNASGVVQERMSASIDWFEIDDSVPMW